MTQAEDRYCRRPPVHYDAVFGVMGAPLRFQTNSAPLFSLAVDTFARFGPPRRETPVLTMRLFVHHVDMSLPQHVWPVIARAQDDYLYATWGPGSTVVADMTRGFVYGFLSPEAQAWPELVREVFLNEPVYATLTRHGYVPLHVAIVLWQGRYPLYLVSDAGVDVSMLLYEAAREGWRISSTHVTRAVRTARGWHFWGVPWWLHLPPDAARRFPELEALRAVPEGNGEWRIVIDVEDVWPGSTEPHAGPGPIILVRGNHGRPDYDWIEPDEFLSQVAVYPVQDEAWLQEEVHDVTSYLADQGTYWLEINDDTEASLAVLDELGERHWRM